MIVVDSSALVAIVVGEPERDDFLDVIAGADRILISGLTLLETSIVTFGRLGQAGIAALQLLIQESRCEVVPLDASQAQLAFDCFQHWGKGIHSQARLNICDCAAYALAKLHGAPLLYKGYDFAATDIVAAMQSRSAPP